MINMTPEQQADMLYSKANVLHNSDSYDEASAHFEEYVKRYPESDRADNAKLKIGNGFFQQKKYDEAMTVYQEIIDAYPNSDATDQAMLFMGDIFFAQQKRDQSVEAYQKLLHKYPRLCIPIAISAQDRINAMKDMDENLKILSEGSEDIKDNAQYDIADIYYTIFRDYERAKDEFQQVIEKWQDSELADEALWRIGECCWNIASRQLPPRLSSEKLSAYITLTETLEKYPQLLGIDTFKLNAPWPAGERGDNYELAYAQVRRIVNKYPDIKEMRITDFLPENYKNAFDSWFYVIAKYSHTDTASAAPERIARSLINLGNLYYNMNMRHLGCAFYRESLMIFPTPEGHLGMSRYYANITSVSGQGWAYRRAFFHIKQAEDMTPPDSPMANSVSWAKEWMNYKMRIEALERSKDRR